MNKTFAATDPASSTSRGHSHQIAPGVVIETFSVPVQGDGVPPEINRVGLCLEDFKCAALLSHYMISLIYFVFKQIVSAVLGSIGISNIGNGGEGFDVMVYFNINFCS